MKSHCQANVANINRLVLSCEEIFEREREAWMSTSMATKLLSDGGINSGGAVNSTTAQSTLAPTQKDPDDTTSYDTLSKKNS